jgi:hypothetical protein
MEYTVEKFNADLENPYAWPGGYPRFFVTQDGEALSFKAAQENKRLIETAIKENSNDGWCVVGCDINWEDPDLYCCHTGRPIESAYA